MFGVMCGCLVSCVHILWCHVWVFGVMCGCLVSCVGVWCHVWVFGVMCAYSLVSGVPIDMVAGTSIGAFVGALYCEERDSRIVETRCRDWARRMAGVMNKVLDLTYPTTSMFSGK